MVPLTKAFLLCSVCNCIIYESIVSLVIQQFNIIITKIQIHSYQSTNNGSSREEVHATAPLPCTVYIDSIYIMYIDRPI